MERPDDGSRGAVTVGVIALATAFLGALVVAATRGSLVVASESDGHFLAAGWIRCGDPALIRHVTRAAWPSGFPTLVALVHPVVPDPLLAARLVSVAATAVLVGAVAAVGQRTWASPGATALAGCLAATTPQLLTYGTLGTTDATAAALLAAALPAALAATSPSSRAAVTAGVLAGLATQVRYQAFPPAIALVAALGPATTGTLATRVRTVGLAAAGAAAVLALGSLLPGADPADLGGLRNAFAAVPNAQGAPTDLASLPARYGHAALLALWLLNGLPALGLVQLGVGGLAPATRRRDRWILLVPALVTFVAVGWFPRPGAAELRRLFLPLLAPAVLGAVALARRLATSPARRRSLAAVGALHGLFTVNQLFHEIPARGLWADGAPGPKVGFDVPARAWDLDPEPGHAEAVAARLRELADADRHVRTHPPGCGLALTDVVAASRAWPAAWLEQDLTVERLDARLSDLGAVARVAAPTWVVVRADRGDLHDGTAVLGGAAVLVAQPGPPGLQVLRITPAR